MSQNGFKNVDLGLKAEQILPTVLWEHLRDPHHVEGKSMANMFADADAALAWLSQWRVPRLKLDT